MTTPTSKTLIEQEAELLETGLALQQEGLRLLLAEMTALATLIPGAEVMAEVLAPVDPEAAARTEAEVEASFDNMPI